MLLLLVLVIDSNSCSLPFFQSRLLVDIEWFCGHLQLSSLLLRLVIRLSLILEIKPIVKVLPYLVYTVVLISLGVHQEERTSVNVVDFLEMDLFRTLSL